MSAAAELTDRRVRLAMPSMPAGDFNDVLRKASAASSKNGAPDVA
jgi:hypothetical protein